MVGKHHGKKPFGRTTRAGDDIKMDLQKIDDTLRAGRSGDQILLGVRLSEPVQSGPRAHPDSCKMVTGSLSRE
jgi:hypothetical protein